MKRITLALTGASGAPYALRLLECLVQADYRVYVLASSAARVVLKTEQGIDWPASPQALSARLCADYGAREGQIVACGKEEWFSPVASGSAAPKQMVVCPCSMGTVSAIAHGASDNLIERAADVVIKERGQLILVPRETPFSAIHLENMLSLARLGVTIMPAAPGFYHEPRSIDDLVDFMVARVLDHLEVEHTLCQRWGYSPT
ncbi:3-polyprenyl-4-hydroxybenzoate decarboxylase [Aeromonas diversa CDC 2478-85]|uniref:Flavin prenyltransferase UbiX n=1 Tax=Aeromonas diversa CDC 2478-85 TaxID=1268237 RepID=N9VMQ4_9GAMM|nr:flavin prenyltransferase UbiX [Aeromonas diversa]ENY72636.1 3-polyprenyl-4-hydroxybenzoate decarboxylase [Aeromonas diversa CDC 2478-85]